MSAKSVVYADGHIDARGPGGFNSEQGLPQNSVEALDALHKSVDVANENSADLFLVAGDLFDTGKPSPEIVARAKSEFARLDTAKVILADGNHDQQGVLVGHRTAIASYFSEQPWCAGTLSEPGVVEFNGIYIAGMPWIRVSNSNALGSTNEALEAYIEQLASQIPDGAPSMLMGHMTVAECSFDSGKRGSEINMVTSTLEASVPTKILDEGPWSLTRLGHIHKRQQLSDKTGYTGSPYKVSFGETKDDKGVDLVTLNDDNTSTVEFQKFLGRQLIKIDLTLDTPTPAVSAKPGDIVRIVSGSDQMGKAESLAKAFASSGALSHIHRMPDEVIAVQREAQYSTEMAPADALAAYLEKKEVPESKRPGILATFSDVASSCGH